MWYWWFLIICYFLIMLGHFVFFGKDLIGPNFKLWEIISCYGLIVFWPIFWLLIFYAVYVAFDEEESWENC